MHFHNKRAMAPVQESMLPLLELGVLSIFALSLFLVRTQYKVESQAPSLPSRKHVSLLKFHFKNPGNYDFFDTYAIVLLSL